MFSHFQDNFLRDFQRTFSFPLNVDFIVWKLSFILVGIMYKLSLTSVPKHLQQLEGKQYSSGKDAKEHLRLTKGTLNMIWLSLLKLIILGCSVEVP